MLIHSTTFRCLGVVFSAHMSWETCVNSVLTKLARITGIVSRPKYILSPKIKILVYRSLFYSHLNYCQHVWGTTSFSNLQKLYIMQKRYLWNVYNGEYNTTISFCHKTGNITTHKLYYYRLSSRYNYEVRRNIHNLDTLAHLETNDHYYKTRHKEQSCHTPFEYCYRAFMLFFTIIVKPSSVNRFWFVLLLLSCT